MKRGESKLCTRRNILTGLAMPLTEGIVAIIPMAAVGLTPAKAQWLRIERTVTMFFFVFVGVGIVVNLASLIREMVHGSAGIDGL